jgi:hypothetical protein
LIHHDVQKARERAITQTLSQVGGRSMIEAQVMQRAHYPRSVESVGKLSRELGCAAPKVAPNLFAFLLGQPHDFHRER